MTAQALNQLKLQRYHAEFTRKLFEIEYGLEQQSFEQAVTDFELLMHVS